MAELNGWIEFDDSDFQRGLDRLESMVSRAAKQALTDIGEELLRLSQLEVPFRSGHLKDTGNSEQRGDEVVVGYHTPYAAYVHEGRRFDGSRPIRHYSNRRKGKYLEDPMKKNLSIFRRHFDEGVGRVYAGG